MRRPTALRSLPALLIAVVLAVLPAATATGATGDVYEEIAQYSWEDAATSRVAISDDLIAVSRGSSFDAGEGTVSVMRVDEAGGVLDSFEIFAPADAVNFGVGLAIDKDSGRLYVGSYSSNTVYEYRLSTIGGGWAWEASREFRPDPASGLRSFGESLSLLGNKLAVGAMGTAIDTGAVLVVDLVSGDMQRALAPNLQMTGLLGDEVVLTDRLLISAAHQTKLVDADGIRVQAGRVFVWDLSDLSTPRAIIDHPLLNIRRAVHKTRIFGGSGSVAGFGYQLAVSETDLYVSSPAEANYTSDDVNDPQGGDNNTSIDGGTSTGGAIYRFSLADFQQVGSKIVPPPHMRGLGINMAVEGNALLAAAQTRLDGQRGQVEVYDIPTLETSPTPGDLMRQQPTPVQTLEGSDAVAGDQFGNKLSGSTLKVDGGRAITSALNKAYLFSPIIPNVTEWPMTVDAPSIVYGQEGRIAASVPGLGVPVTVQLELNGEQHEAGTDSSGTAVFEFEPAEHPAGTYPAEVSFVAPGGRDTGTAATDYLVAKAPTTVVDTNVEVR